MPCRFRAHAFPLPCRAAMGLECVFPIWLTRCGRVWFTLAMSCLCRAHAVLRPCLSENDFSRPRHSTACPRHGMCELTSAVERCHVGNLPVFGFFRLPFGLPRSLLIEAYLSQMNVASVKPKDTCHGRGKGYYFGARTWVLL